MKIEIEVSEAEIKTALDRHVRAAIADHVNAWGMHQKFKDMVAAEYDTVTRTLVKEMLSDAPSIRQQVHKEMISKIRGQLTAAMKNGGKT